MAKRPAGKPRKSKAKDKSGISPKSKQNLSKELKKARARIRGMMSSMGSSYDGPRIEDFYLNNVLDLIKHGTHINTIYALIKNTTAKKLKRQRATTPVNEVVANLYGGAPVTQDRYSKMMKTIAKANKNIKEAKEKYDMIGDEIMPSYFTPEDILNKSTTIKKLDRIINVIDKAFVPSKLIPVAINDDGEAGTMAELQYLNSFIIDENKKRAEARKEVKRIYDTKGFFRTQQEFDVLPIETDSWGSIDKWRKRSGYYTDAKDLDRANNWLTNYINSLSDTVTALRLDRGLDTDSEIFIKLEAIFNIINKISSADQVRTITRSSDYIGMQENYFMDLAELDDYVDNLYQAWEEIERRVL